VDTDNTKYGLRLDSVGKDSQPVRRQLALVGEIPIAVGKPTACPTGKTLPFHNPQPLLLQPLLLREGMGVIVNNNSGVAEVRLGRLELTKAEMGDNEVSV